MTTKYPTLAMLVFISYISIKKCIIIFNAQISTSLCYRPLEVNKLQETPLKAKARCVGHINRWFISFSLNMWVSHRALICFCDNIFLYRGSLNLPYLKTSAGVEGEWCPDVHLRLCTLLRLQLFHRLHLVWSLAYSSCVNRHVQYSHIIISSDHKLI